MRVFCLSEAESLYRHLRLESAPRFGESAAAMDTTTTQRPRRILWENVLTVVSAAILISAEVFGAAFAGSWAIANLLALGTIGARLLDGLFVLCGIVVMVQFVRAASRVEPFVAD
jgi:hypothetical protein